MEYCITWPLGIRRGFLHRSYLRKREVAAEELANENAERVDVGAFIEALPTTCAGLLYRPIPGSSRHTCKNRTYLTSLKRRPRGVRATYAEEQRSPRPFTSLRDVPDGVWKMRDAPYFCPSSGSKE
jgi:hypothetical protein